MSIKSKTYGVRTALGHTDAAGERTAGWTEQFSESVRALNHLTIGDDPIPAPEVYAMLGDLAHAAHLLPQLLTQLADGLTRSLDEYDVYDTTQAPQMSVAQARTQLETAAVLARQVGDALDAAQTAIADQGYRDQ